MKRFLTMIMSAAMGALIAVALMRGATSVSAAPQSAQTSAAPQSAPGDCGPGKSDGAHAGGKVTGVSGSTIAVAGRDGQAQSILTTASTSIDLDGKAVSLSAIAAGQFIHADGATDSAGAFTATAVHASTSQPQGHGPGGPGKSDGAHAGGKVTGVSGSTIAVAGRDGQAQSILTTASTSIDLDGKAVSLSAIAAGQFIHADGATDSAGAFTATAVHASTSRPQGHGPRP